MQPSRTVNMYNHHLQSSYTAILYSDHVQSSYTIIMYSRDIQSSCTHIMYSHDTLSSCMVHVYKTRQIWRRRSICGPALPVVGTGKTVIVSSHAQSTKNFSSAGELKRHQVPCEHAASTTHLFVQELTVLKELNKGIKVSGSSVGVELQGCHHLGAQVGPVDGFEHLCHCEIVVVQPQVPALHACTTLTCHVSTQWLEE